MANINDRINGQEFESASPLAHAVRYDRAQVKTEEQKKQARENIGCYCEAGGGGGSSGGDGAFVVNVSLSEDALTMDKTAKEIWEAAQSSTIIVRQPPLEGYDYTTIVRSAKKRIDTLPGNLRGIISHGESEGDAPKYLFDVDGILFRASADDEYPYYYTG